MAGFNLGFAQKLQQKQTLAPQMRQGLTFLQKTALELRAEIHHEMMSNPVIEDVTNRMEGAMSAEAPDRGGYEDHMERRELDERLGGGISEVLGTGDTEDGVRDYFLRNLENAPQDEETQSRRDFLFDSMVGTETYQQHLLDQVPLSDIAPEDRPLAEILIGDIDDDGYFRGSFADIEMVTGADEAKLTDVLAQIRAFDPVGSGARDLRECWLSQMEKLDDSPWEDEVRAVLENHFDDLVARREDEIRAALDLSAEDYRKVLAEIKTFDAQPGRVWAARARGNSAFTPRAGNVYVQRTRPGEYVKPEIFAERAEDGTWTARVDGRDLPEIHISKRYLKMLEDPSVSTEAKSYVRERIRAAETLRDSIRKRQETIRGIAQAILDAQPDVPLQGMRALRPLTMQQVAAKVGVAGTTVSRTVRDKYMRLPFGVVELRRFFTAGLATDQGAAVANTTVKSRIKEIIANENAADPLSDERIGDLLKAEGVQISRRTVAKYRAALGIPGAIERKLT